MVPVCDKRYHIYNRFRHFGAEIRNCGTIHNPYTSKKNRSVLKGLSIYNAVNSLSSDDYYGKVQQEVTNE